MLSTLIFVLCTIINTIIPDPPKDQHRESA